MWMFLFTTVLAWAGPVEIVSSDEPLIIFVDGTEVGTTPLTVDLKNGKHHIEAKAVLYLPDQIGVNLFLPGKGTPLVSFSWANNKAAISWDNQGGAVAAEKAQKEAAAAAAAAAAEKAQKEAEAEEEAQAAKEAAAMGAAEAAQEAGAMGATEAAQEAETMEATEAAQEAETMEATEAVKEEEKEEAAREEEAAETAAAQETQKEAEDSTQETSQQSRVEKTSPSTTDRVTRDEYAKPKKERTQMRSGNVVTGGILGVALGFEVLAQVLWLSAADSAEQARNIDDPSNGRQYADLTKDVSQKRTLGTVMAVLGGGVAAAGVTLRFTFGGPSNKQFGATRKGYNVALREPVDIETLINAEQGMGVTP